MEKVIRQLKRNRFFALFVFLFAYAQSIQTRLWGTEELNWFIFTPDAALAKLVSATILVIIISYFLKAKKQSETFSSAEALKIFAKSLVVFLLWMKVMGFVIALMFDTVDRNFNKETFMYTAFSDLMDGFIYGSFFLVYYYYRKNKSHEQQLVNYNHALSISRINQLKAQLNPHFLFNNLNVLDQLIEEDKHIASNFLNEFAEIYRFVLQVSDKHLISIQEELAFATKYFSLLKHKYGNAYVLETHISNVEGNIVPLTLQLLLENVLKHNVGTESKPVYITIHLAESLLVSNNIVPKRHAEISTGKALINLQEQYALLTSRQIEIIKTTEKFCVSIPLIPIL